MKFTNHPLNIVQNILNAYSDYDITFQVAYYKRGRLNTDAERIIVEVPGKDFTLNKFVTLSQDLETDEELCLLSEVFIAGKPWHIPMIDFEGPFDLNKLEMLRKVLPEHPLDNLYLYDSGRSLHGYLVDLISFDGWLNFMGDLLLLNMKDKPVSDSRWVGHRLKGRVAALRWTCNTDRHSKSPELLGKFTDLEKSYGLRKLG